VIDRAARVLPQRPKHVRCFSDPYQRHGEGHNSVCVCHCVYCAAERNAERDGRTTLVTPVPVQGDLFVT
jgi:hypothetical protein